MYDSQTIKIGQKIENKTDKNKSKKNSADRDEGKKGILKLDTTGWRSLSNEIQTRKKDKLDWQQENGAIRKRKSGADTHRKTEGWKGQSANSLSPFLSTSATVSLEAYAHRYSHVSFANLFWGESCSNRKVR